MATAVQGKKIIYLYRIASEEAQQAGTMISFATENGRTKSKDADSTMTKDGAIRTPGASEVEISSTSILAKGDTMIDKLEDAMDEDKLIQIWEVNLDEPVAESQNKFKAMYFEGYLTELEKTSNAEDNVEVSLTFGINGVGKRGEATVTTAQQMEAQYAFKDTTKTSV